MTQAVETVPSPSEVRHYAGEVKPFPTGRITYLAPKPLPTGALPVDYCYTVGAMNDRYLEFGGGKSFAFAWRALLGLPFFGFLFAAVICPFVIALLLYWMGDSLDEAAHAFWGVSSISFWLGFWGAIVAFLLLTWPRLEMYREVQKMCPMRFNRQRREVGLVPENEVEPIFVPWEEVEAWAVEAQGVSQYGVRRQYGLGLGFHHPKTGKRLTLEFETHGLPLALGNWEALRAYMEYEVHTLEELHPHGELMTGADAPKEEGVAFFHAARRNLRRRRKAGEVGWIYTFFWHLYHVMTFWTIPNRLVEWENRKLQRLLGQSLPAAMEAWSEALPEAQWAQPSETLKRQSAWVRQQLAAFPDKPVPEIYAELNVQRETLQG